MLKINSTDSASGWYCMGRRRVVRALDEVDLYAALLVYRLASR